MKKLTFVLASLMLCLAVSMTSCDKKGASSDSDASASDTTATSDASSASTANAQGNDVVAIIYAGVDQLKGATTIEEVETVYVNTGSQVQAWTAANPDAEITDDMRAAEKAFMEAYDAQKAAINSGEVTVTDDMKDAMNAAQDAANQGAQAVQAAASQF